MGYSCLRPDILRHTDILMKLAKNLETIISSLSTRYLVKKNYMRTFAVMWSPSPCSNTLEFWWTSFPLSANVITECPLLHYLWSADLPRSFSHMIVLIFIFSQYFISRFHPKEMSGVIPHGLYRDSLILTRK